MTKWADTDSGWDADKVPEVSDGTDHAQLPGWERGFVVWNIPSAPLGKQTPADPSPINRVEFFGITKVVNALLECDGEQNGTFLCAVIRVAAEVQWG